MQLSTENKFTSAKQFTSYITKTFKDYGFKRFEKVSGENSAMEYHKEKTFVVGTSYIVVGGIQDINEAKEIKKSFESFFKIIFGDKRNCVSKEIRKTYTKNGQTYMDQHKHLLSEEDLQTVRYDVVIYKEWSRHKF